MNVQLQLPEYLTLKGDIEETQNFLIQNNHFKELLFDICEFIIKRKKTWKLYFEYKRDIECPNYFVPFLYVLIRPAENRIYNKIEKKVFSAFREKMIENFIAIIPIYSEDII